MFQINFNHQVNPTAVEGNENQEVVSETRLYDEMVSCLVGLKQLIDKGITITSLREKNNRNEFAGNRRFPNQSIISKCIEAVGNDIYTTSPEENALYDELDKIVDKYKLHDMNELINKFNELIVKDECLKTITNNVNAIAPNTISDTATLITYISELVKSFASFKQNSNSAFINVSALMNENAMLKAQLQNLQQQINK